MFKIPRKKNHQAIEAIYLKEPPGFINTMNNKRAIRGTLLARDEKFTLY